MKFIKLTAVAICLSSLSSCALASYILRIPTGLLHATTKSLSIIGLSDEEASPITDVQEVEAAELSE